MALLTEFTININWIEVLKFIGYFLAGVFSVFILFALLFKGYNM